MSNPNVLRNSDGLVLSQDEKKAIRYFGKSRNVVIPKGVSEVGHFAFAYNPDIVTVVLPDSVESIGAYAFADCTNLEEINIPEEATDIGMCAFRGCKSLFSVYIPNGVRFVGHFAFYECTAGLPAKWRTEAVTGIERTVTL